VRSPGLYNVDHTLTILVGYVYALLYSYFESFPLVYGPEGYDFPGGVQYLPFAALLIGEAFSFLGYAIWAWYVPEAASKSFHFCEREY
jgi:DHA1 family multidrug resistance protein-like MFS transporter